MYIQNLVEAIQIYNIKIKAQENEYISCAFSLFMS